MNIKLRLLTFITTSFLFACQSDNSSKNVKTNSNEGSKSTIEGIYVSNDYLESLVETKSPKASAANLTDVVALVIPKLNNDSAWVLVNWNNHEGFDFKIFNKLKNEEDYYSTSLKDFDDESNHFKISIENKNGIDYLNLYKFNNKNNLLTTKVFLKQETTIGDKDLSWPIQYAVNKILFNKKMIYTDKKGVEKFVTLTDNGDVLGHPNFLSYRITTDFIGEQPAELDRITFIDHNKNEYYYHFKHESDKTIFYASTYNDQLGEYTIDKFYEFSLKIK